MARKMMEQDLCKAAEEFLQEIDEDLGRINDERPDVSTDLNKGCVKTDPCVIDDYLLEELQHSNK